MYIVIVNSSSVFCYPQRIDLPSIFNEIAVLLLESVKYVQDCLLVYCLESYNQ